MKPQLAHCSARDRDVLIVVTEMPSQDGHANLHDAEVVCLEIGAQCTGRLCPIGAAPPVVMAARLVHNGLQTPLQAQRVLSCDACGRETTQVLVEPHHATCTVCGATTERF